MKNLKQLFLLLLLSFSTIQAQERSDIQVLIDNIATGVPNTALKIRTVLNAIADGTAQTGDVKEIDVSTAYIAANFDPSGLGFNERAGWAICNGNNGTRDRGGRVAIQYNASYPVLGATGGSKDAVVVEHSHLSGSYNTGGGNLLYTNIGLGNGSDKVYQSTNSTGVSGTGMNMQPYIVTLFIQKL